MNRKSIREIAAGIRRGEDSALRNVEEAIRHHEASRLNAYIRFDAEGARRQAKRIDAAVARGRDPGPLAGIPVSVKDLYGVEGLPIRAGTKRELPARWRQEGFLVRTLRDLGAVIMGKTHTVELAFGGVGINYNTGTPVNPWDGEKHRVPGGSSTGAGPSLWEGSARIALGTDTGGSIRIPASATGVVGHRQTTGRWPTTGVVPLSTTLDTVGLLTHTAEDTLYAFQTIDRLVDRSAGSQAGHGVKTKARSSEGTVALRVRDPSPRDQSGRPGAETDDVTGSVAGLRIGVPRSELWDRADPGIAAVVHRSLSELETAGAAIFEVDAPELDEAGARYLGGGLVQPECVEFLKRELPEWTGILDPTVSERLKASSHASAVDYIGVLRLRHRLRASIHTRLDTRGVDVLATPTLPVTPPAVVALSRLEDYRKANQRMLSGTGPASMLDMCTISLPAGLDRRGMPVGLQLIGRTGADEALLGYAVAAERVLGTNLVRLGVPPRVRMPGPRSGANRP